jgi:hypothetical protein
MIDAPELQALVYCLRACQHTLDAAVGAGGRANLDLARGCAMLARIQADRLERLLDAKNRRPPVGSRRRGSSP